MKLKLEDRNRVAKVNRKYTQCWSGNKTNC